MSWLNGTIWSFVSHLINFFMTHLKLQLLLYSCLSAINTAKVKDFCDQCDFFWKNYIFWLERKHDPIHYQSTIPSNTATVSASLFLSVFLGLSDHLSWAFVVCVSFTLSQLGSGRTAWDHVRERHVGRGSQCGTLRVIKEEIKDRCPYPKKENKKQWSVSSSVYHIVNEISEHSENCPEEVPH